MTNPSSHISHSSPSNPDATMAGLRFDNTYARLPEIFYAKQLPGPVRAPRLTILNRALAESMGLDTEALAGDEGTALFAGNRMPEGAEPIAQAYAGHQFGHFTMLGDGRAVLLGEHLTPQGQRLDIQLKGSGRTPFSRGGDGRATLGPMLREYIISEAMHGLGIPSTRSLAVVTTGESVYREKALPGAILTRVAASHIRVGTFEYAARLGNDDAVKVLADYTIQRHYPELMTSETPYLEFLKTVMAQQARLVSQWQHVGFIHGVMNTDNMAISGEAIDYGPCAFMDAYDPSTVFSSIDRHGRYAYGNQPPIAQWNLARFAETLIPLLHTDRTQAITMAEAVISSFPELYQRFWLTGMCAKLGIFAARPQDEALVESLLVWMHLHKRDFTTTFRLLSSELLQCEAFFSDPNFTDWYAAWQTRLSEQPESLEKAYTLMRANNPIVIPRNLRVEEALSAAVEQDDLSVLNRLLAALERPYEDSPETSDYRDPPAPGGAPYQTFCGT